MLLNIYVLMIPSLFEMNCIQEAQLSELLLNTTPLFEILSASFFIMAFGSFRKRILEILDYEFWHKSLIVSNLDRFNFLIEATSNFESQIVSPTVIHDVRSENNKLITEMSDYEKDLKELEIRSTICFDRLSITTGFYCMFIIFISVTPFQNSLDLFDSLIVFSGIYGFISFLITFLDLLNRWVETDTRKWLRDFLHEISFNKLIGILIVLFIISYSNYFIGYLSIFHDFFNNLITNTNLIVSLCLIPSAIVLFYYIHYLMQFRSFRKKIRPINERAKNALNECEEIYKRADYTNKTNRDIFRLE